MTAKTSQKLADALRKAGMEELAIRAEHDEFHDYLSPHDLPDLMLDLELTAIIASGHEEKMREAEALRNRHHAGEFDADMVESDEWAASPDGKAAFSLLLKK